jgi:hypothetical protein
MGSGFFSMFFQTQTRNPKLNNPEPLNFEPLNPESDQRPEASDQNPKDIGE